MLFWGRINKRIWNEITTKAHCSNNSFTLVPFLSYSLLTPTLAQSKKKINSLTEAEKKEGWKLLFNGSTLDGWRGAYMDSLPRKGWEVKDGILDVQESGGGEASFGGDLVTIDEFTNFDLKVEFKLTSDANSGIK